MAIEETEILYITEKGAHPPRLSAMRQVSYKFGYKCVEAQRWALIVIDRRVVCELDKRWWMVMKEMSRTIIVIDAPTICY